MLSYSQRDYLFRHDLIHQIKIFSGDLIFKPHQQEQIGCMSVQKREPLIYIP